MNWKIRNLLFLSVVLLVTSALADQQYGVFYYTSDGASVTITGQAFATNEIDIPASINGLPVVTIGANAFDNAFPYASSITIPDTVTSIGASAFMENQGLTNLVLGSNIMSIGNLAFAGCIHLGNLMLPSGLKYIGFAAFSTDGQLTNLVTGSNIVSIGLGAFSGIPINSFTITPSVTSIGDNAFNGCENLTNIVFPSSLASISEGAFQNCLSLTGVTFSNGVTGIGSYAFYNCPLTNLIIPPSVTSIGSNAFTYCAHLTNVQILGDCNIGASAFGFYNLGGNTPFIVDPIQNVYIEGGEIGSAAFCYCTNLVSVTFGDEVRSIDFFAFGISPLVKSVVIPNSCTNIATAAFNECQLTNLMIGTNVSSIGDHAFISTSIPNLVIPDSVKYIGEDAFENDGALTNLVIGSNVTELDFAAFAGFGNLTTILMKGNAPTSDYGNVFYGNPNAVVYYLPHTTGWGTNFAGTPTELWNPAIQTHDGNFGVQGNQFGFNITGSGNLPVVVEVCTNLLNPVWSPVANVTLTNGTYYFSEPLQAASQRFYGLGFP